MGVEKKPQAYPRKELKQVPPVWKKKKNWPMREEVSPGTPNPKKEIAPTGKKETGKTRETQ